MRPRPLPRAFAHALGIALVFAAAPALGDPAAVPSKEPARVVPVDVAARLGGSFRIGDAPAYAITERGGTSFGLSVFAAPSPRFSVGLSYEHTGLGYERGGASDADRVEVARTLDVLFAGLRLHLWSDEKVRLSAQIGAGLAWQSATAAGFVSSGFGQKPIGVRCTAAGGPDLGLRAGLGAEILLGSNVWFVTDVTLDNTRLGSGPLEECIGGAGTVTLFGARVGFAYRFDDVSRWVR